MELNFGKTLNTNEKKITSSMLIMFSEAKTEISDHSKISCTRRFVVNVLLTHTLLTQ